MEHPAKGTAGDASPAGSFHRCRPDRRCGVCRLLDGQQRREKSLFKTVISQDEALLTELDRLAGLFYDAAVRS
jgi:hypothetical protein